MARYTFNLTEKSDSIRQLTTDIAVAAGNLMIRISGESYNDCGRVMIEERFGHLLLTVWRPTDADPVIRTRLDADPVPDELVSPISREINRQLKNLPTDRDRLEALDGICLHCGRTVLPCHCTDAE